MWLGVVQLKYDFIEQWFSTLTVLENNQGA